MATLNLGAVTAYAIAKKNGFTGTEKEWLNSLQGEKGDKGDTTEYDDQPIRADIEKKINKPETAGTTGQILQTNGDGTTSWVDKPQGGGGGSAATETFEVDEDGYLMVDIVEDSAREFTINELGELEVEW